DDESHRCGGSRQRNHRPWCICTTWIRQLFGIPGEDERRPSMHTHSLDRWHHAHVFLGEKHDRHERRTWFVVALTAATMVAEITGGTLFGSMAVVADGVHMSTHVAAL